MLPAQLKAFHNINHILGDDRKGFHFNLKNSGIIFKSKGKSCYVLNILV